MINRNIFQVGGHVSGESMIGYDRYLKSLRNLAFCKDISLGVSLSGMHQMGKTSLLKTICNEADKSEYITVFVDLGETKSDGTDLMFQLLKRITKSLKRELSKRGTNDEFILEQIELIANCDCDCQDMRDDFKAMFEAIGEYYHTILVIDEYDSARAFNDYDHELLRTLMTDPLYNLSLFLISRSHIKFIVNDNHNNSKLAASIKKEAVTGFNSSDVDAFYSVLEEHYGITATEDDRNTVNFYAGTVPILYSSIGYAAADAALSGKPVDFSAICKRLSRDFYDYYETVFDRLDNNNYIKAVYSAVIGPSTEATREIVDALEEVGYLSQDSDGTYISFAKYFTSFLRSKKIENSDEWNHIITTEKKLKGIVETQLTRFGIAVTDKQMYEQFLEEYYASQGSHYNPRLYDTFISAALQNHNQNSTLLDVISLKHTVNAFIKPLWGNCFAQYFNNDSFSKWEPHFAMCARARDPLAHGHKDYLTQAERDITVGYCEMLCSSIAEHTNVDMSPLTLPNSSSAAQSTATDDASQDLSVHIGQQFTFVVNDINSRGSLRGTLSEIGINATVPTTSLAVLTDQQQNIGASFCVRATGLSPQGDRLLVEPVSSS